MSHTTNELDAETEDFIDSIADGDYIFVVDSDGNLKSLLLPDDYNQESTPENVGKVMKALGVSAIEKQTLH
jgi:hypothetical protein